MQQDKIIHPPGCIVLETGLCGGFFLLKKQEQHFAVNIEATSMPNNEGWG
jgi:hypothetical protein